jgi:hypothetical protein
MANFASLLPKLGLGGLGFRFGLIQVKENVRSFSSEIKIQGSEMMKGSLSSRELSLILVWRKWHHEAVRLCWNIACFFWGCENLTWKGE